MKELSACNCVFVLFDFSIVLYDATYFVGIWLNWA